MQVAVSRVHFPVTTLGPGQRVGVWLQGCSIRCPGCISLDTWLPDANFVDIGELVIRIAAYAPDADGLTVSGGEPFDQSEALAALLEGWREHGTGSVFVFTGREFEEVSPWLTRNEGLIDAIMTGPFRSDLPQTMAMRGSDNQTLHILSEQGREFATYERPTAPSDRRLDVAFDEDGDAWFAGIPARGELGRLRRALAAAGHSAVTSESKGSVAR